MESSNLEVLIYEGEPEPREELAKTSEREPTTSGRKYPLRERKTRTTYASVRNSTKTEKELVINERLVLLSGTVLRQRRN